MALLLAARRRSPPDGVDALVLHVTHFRRLGHSRGPPRERTPIGLSHGNLIRLVSRRRAEELGMDHAPVPDQGAPGDLRPGKAEVEALTDRRANRRPVERCERPPQHSRKRGGVAVDAPWAPAAPASSATSTRPSRSIVTRGRRPVRAWRSASRAACAGAEVGMVLVGKSSSMAASSRMVVPAWVARMQSAMDISVKPWRRHW